MQIYIVFLLLKLVSPSHLPYLRHHNGNGKIFGISEICEKSFLDKFSEIRENTSVWSSRIEHSKIIDSAIRRAVIKYSYVEASEISGGTIKSSTIACELVTDNAKIEQSTLLDKFRIGHNAQTRNIKAKNLTVKGNAKLWDWNNSTIFDGLEGYISSGIWYSPPKVFRIADFTVTESIIKDGIKYAFVGCREFPIPQWLKKGERYGKIQGLSSEQIDEIRQRFLQWLDCD